MTRAAVVQTLAGSPLTRSVLAEFASSAGTTVTALATGVTPSYAGPTAPQALLDIWKAPVHLSPTVPGPTYVSNGSQWNVGITSVYGISATNYLHDYERMLQEDVIKIVRDAEVRIWVELPPGGGQYAIAVNVVDSGTGRSINDMEKPVVTARILPLGGPDYWTDLSLVPNSDATSLVAMFPVGPKAYGTPGSASTSIRTASLMLSLRAASVVVYFGGVTITRL